MTGIIFPAAAAYAAGCVPAAALVERLVGPHSWSRWAGWAVDVVKGFAAVVLFEAAHPWGAALAATAVVAGHVWPIAGGAPGRQPLLVAAGALSAVSPIAVPAWGLIWGLAYVASGWPSAASAAATVLAPLAVGVVAGWPLGLMCVPVCVLVLERMREPIRRVLLGTEPRHLWRGGG